jgi:transmembrane sensor
MSGNKDPHETLVDKLRRRGPAIEAAGEWLFEMRERELSRRQREQLVDSLRESPVLVAEMLRARQVDQLLSEFDLWERIEPVDLARDSAVVEFPEMAAGDAADRQRPPRRHFRLLMLAPCVLAAFILVFVGATFWSNFIGWKTIATEVGERRELRLADGSTVQVGPATRLRVRFESTGRRVVLEHGDALFRVARDEARPFTVDAGGTVVRAVGTAFAVARQDDEVVVTVSEGRVAVTRPAARTISFSAPPPVAEVALIAGQQVAVTPSGEVSTVREVDSQRELAWTEGKLVFMQEPVGNIIEQFNRRNRLQLRLQDDALLQRPVSGVFDSFDPASFAEFLAIAEPVRVTRVQDEIIIAPTGGR